MDWWTIVNRCRALENTAFVAAANQGASLKHYPPYSWPGGSQVIDYDGRILAKPVPDQAKDRRSADRYFRPATRTRDPRGHHMLAHLRTEAYPVYASHRYPPQDIRKADSLPEVSYEENNRLIDESKQQLGADLICK